MPPAPGKKSHVRIIYPRHQASIDTCRVANREIVEASTLNVRVTSRVVSPLAMRSSASRCWCSVSLGLRPNLTPSGLGAGPAVAGSLQDQLALELGDATEHGEHQTRSGGRDAGSRFEDRKNIRMRGLMIVVALTLLSLSPAKNRSVPLGFAMTPALH